MTRYRVRLVRDRATKARPLAGPTDAAAILRREARGMDREGFWALYLDARHAVIGVELVSLGTLSASLIHPREVFKGAILANAVGVIAGHNHPSGDTQPSEEDLEVTQRLVEAGELLGIPVIDHIIVAGSRFYSFRDHGRIKDEPESQR